MPLWLPKEEVGKIIKDIRRNRLRIGQGALAEKLGMPGSQSQVSKWERGEVMPEGDTLAKIARLAGLPVSVFQAPPVGEISMGTPVREAMLLQVLRILDNESAAALELARAAHERARRIPLVSEAQAPAGCRTGPAPGTEAPPPEAPE